MRSCAARLAPFNKTAKQLPRKSTPRSPLASAPNKWSDKPKAACQLSTAQILSLLCSNANAFPRHSLPDSTSSTTAAGLTEMHDRVFRGAFRYSACRPCSAAQIAFQECQPVCASPEYLGRHKKKSRAYSTKKVSATRRQNPPQDLPSITAWRSCGLRPNRWQKLRLRWPVPGLQRGSPT